MWQTILSLRQTGFAGPQPELLAHYSIGGQDYHQNHSALRRGADTSADCRVQALSKPNPGFCRGQRKVCDAQLHAATDIAGHDVKKTALAEALQACMIEQVQILLGADVVERP
jgi:hypothetical protein